MNRDYTNTYTNKYKMIRDEQNDYKIEICFKKYNIKYKINPIISMYPCKRKWTCKLTFPWNAVL